MDKAIAESKQYLKGVEEAGSWHTFNEFGR